MNAQHTSTAGQPPLSRCRQRQADAMSQRIRRVVLLDRLVAATDGAAERGEADVRFRREDDRVVRNGPRITVAEFAERYCSRAKG